MSITNGYLDVDQARSYTGQNATVDPEFLESSVTAVSRSIDEFCGRHFYQVTEARTFEVEIVTELEFGPFNDLTTLTTLKTDSAGDGTFETTIAASGYELGPLNAASRTEPFLALRLLAGATFPTTTTGRSDLIQVTGVWGWPAVPPQVKSACRVLLAELVKLQDAPLGFAGGMEMGTAYVGSMAWRKATALLAPLRHPDGFGIA